MPVAQTIDIFINCQILLPASWQMLGHALFCVQTSTLFTLTCQVTVVVKILASYARGLAFNS